MARDDTAAIVVLGLIGLAFLVALLGKKKCSYCGNENPSSNRVCNFCGAQI